MPRNLDTFLFGLGFKVNSLQFTALSKQNLQLPKKKDRPLLLELLLLCEEVDLDEELEDEEVEELDEVVEEMEEDLLLLRFRFLFSLSYRKDNMDYGLALQ